jgi:multiple sugar transport system substrate-binding protein
MTQQISLSVFNHSGMTEEQNILMRSLLDEFERQEHVHVDVEVLDWRVGWTRLVEMAIYGRGPDISEVGSTWVMDLVRMNALNSFSTREVKSIGSEEDFIPTSWNTCITPGSEAGPPTVWGIPWSADVRMIFYRRDLLEQAKIDPATAFEHIDSVNQTLAKLQARGREFPVLFSTLRSHMNIHNMAGWIWDAGGDLMMPDGKQVAFDDPKALRGMRYYFGLGRYMPAIHHKIFDHEVDQLFLSGQVATILSGSWAVGEARASQTLYSKIGLAPMPGASFVGGSHLVVWKHSAKKEAAFALASFLVKYSGKYGVFPLYGLPTYLQDWKKTQFLEEPYFSAFYQGLQKGRSFPTGELWGLVEKRFSDIVPSIWEKVLNSNLTDREIDDILAETIIPFARNLNLSLE